MNQRPVCLLIDESASFASSSDPNFLSVSRETRTCVIFGFQSINGLFAELREKNQILSLLSNVGSRFYMGNTCIESCEWQSADCGESEEWEVGISGEGEAWAPFSENTDPRHRMVSDPKLTWGLKRKRNVPPEQFAALKAGTRKRPMAEAFVRLGTVEGRVVIKTNFPYDVNKKASLWDWFRSSDAENVVTLPSRRKR